MVRYIYPGKVAVMTGSGSWSPAAVTGSVSLRAMTGTFDVPGLGVGVTLDLIFDFSARINLDFA